MTGSGLLVLGLFIFELIFLFFLSRKITSSLSHIFYRISGSHRFSVIALAILLLPGTIIHELSHILMAGMLLVHVGEMDFLPQSNGNEVRLGSAEIGITDPFRRALIGVAPLIIGTAIILSSLWFFNQFSNIYLHAITLFMIFEIGNTMFSSQKDMEGFFALIAALVVVGIVIFTAIYFLKIAIPYQLIAESIFTKGFIDFLSQANLYLLIPIGIDLSVFTIAALMRKTMVTLAR